MWACLYLRDYTVWSVLYKTWDGTMFKYEKQTKVDNFIDWWVENIKLPVDFILKIKVWILFDSKNSKKHSEVLLNVLCACPFSQY